MTTENSTIHEGQTAGPWTVTERDPLLTSTSPYRHWPHVWGAEGTGDVVDDRLLVAIFQRCEDADYVLSLSARVEELTRLNGDLVTALREIAKREGEYSRDHLTHCTNAIENMGRIADEAIAAFERANGGN